MEMVGRVEAGNWQHELEEGWWEASAEQLADHHLVQAAAPVQVDAEPRGRHVWLLRPDITQIPEQREGAKLLVPILTLFPW